MSLVRKSYRTWSKSDVAEACSLYLVTDKRWLDRRTLPACVAEAIVGGVKCVQLREFDLSSVNLARLARDMMLVCRVANVPLIINNDIEAAKIAGADGVHIGQEDMDCAAVRRELGFDAIVGVSVSDLAQAVAAEKDGASYISVGPIFPNPLRGDDELVPISVLEKIAQTVSIPVVASGGIKAENVMELSGAGISGVAVVSSILAAPNIEEAAAELSKEVDSLVR